MSKAEKNPDNPGHVTQIECAARMGQFEGFAERVDKALWGGEGRSGMVKDVNDMLQRSKWAGTFTSVVIGVVATLVTFWLTHTFFPA